MGHMLNNTIQDILVRRARMMGKNTLWVPGTDHASIASQGVAKLVEKGIRNRTDTRGVFETRMGMERRTRRDHT